LITSEDAIASSEAIQKAYESLQKDDWVTVTPPIARAAS
jgi:flavin-binding protein dodecin